MNRGSYTKIEFYQAQSSKHKDVVKTLSQCWAIGCIDIISSGEMKFLTTSVDNVAATLRSNVVATFWQRSVDFTKLKKSYEVYVVLTLQSPCTLQSRDFKKCLAALCPLRFS